MTDFGTMRVSGVTFDEFSRSLTKVIQSLPPEMKRRLHEIRKNYFAWYGFEGAQERLNNRTVSEIFAEYRPVDVQPLASGEVEGVRYELFEAPPSEAADDKPEAED